MTRTYTDYDQLPLTLTADDVANALGISGPTPTFCFMRRTSRYADWTAA